MRGEGRCDWKEIDWW